MFGGAARGGARGFGTPFEQEEFAGPATGQDMHAEMTIGLADAAKGTKTLVHLPTGKDVEVKIPAGLTDGQSIRLKGQGWPVANGKAGDALITVHVAPHPLFKPDGADLRLDLPITLYEAALGGKVRVPTLDGAVELAIPAGTNSGRTFRLKGKGLEIEKRRRRPARHRAYHAAGEERRRVQGIDEEVARRQAVRSAQGYGVMSGCPGKTPFEWTSPRDAGERR